MQVALQNRSIKDVHSTLLRKGFHVKSGSPSGMNYQKGSFYLRLILRDGIIMQAEARTETPTDDVWRPRIRFRQLQNTL